MRNMQAGANCPRTSASASQAASGSTGSSFRLLSAHTAFTQSQHSRQPAGPRERRDSSSPSHSALCSSAVLSDYRGHLIKTRIKTEQSNVGGAQTDPRRR